MTRRLFGTKCVIKFLSYGTASPASCASGGRFTGTLIAKAIDLSSQKNKTFTESYSMLRTIALATALTLAAITSALAQGQGNARERATCRPDVMRFCKQYAKDNDAVSILNCLESNRSRISKACSQVLANHGQ